MEPTDAIKKVAEELDRATSVNRSFNSAHEGWAVIREEVDELWDEVKKRKAIRSDAVLEEEATQIAAMALRFLVDLC